MGSVSHKDKLPVYQAQTSVTQGDKRDTDNLLSEGPLLIEIHKAASQVLVLVLEVDAPGE